MPIIRVGRAELFVVTPWKIPRVTNSGVCNMAPSLLMYVQCMYSNFRVYCPFRTLQSLITVGGVEAVCGHYFNSHEASPFQCFNSV